MRRNGRFCKRLRGNLSGFFGCDSPIGTFVASVAERCWIAIENLGTENCTFSGAAGEKSPLGFLAILVGKVPCNKPTTMVLFEQGFAEACQSL